jgi:mannose-6-phosphate isomerase-like protein (cupin superfamily)
MIEEGGRGWAAADGEDLGQSSRQRKAHTGGYVTNIERDTLQHDDFPRVLYTGRHTQLVLMPLRPGEEIGLETHAGHDHFIRVEEGNGYVLLNRDRRPLENGSAVLIPRWSRAQRRQQLRRPAAAPVHALQPDGAVHRTREEAEAAGH